MSSLKRDSDNASHQSVKRQRVSAPVTELTLVKTTDTTVFCFYVSFSPNGTTAAVPQLNTAALMKTAALINVNDGTIIGLLRGHSDYVTSVTFSPDGTKVASGSSDKTVKLWDVTTGECLKTLKGHSAHVNSVSFSPDGTKVASGSFDNTVKLWDVTSGECLKTLEGHSSRVYSVSFSPDGTKVASGSSDNTVKLWDVTSGVELRSLEGHSLYVLSVSFSPDGTKVASGSYKKVKLWDVTSGECLQTLEGHSKIVNHVSFSADGTKVASASWDDTVKLWDVTNGKCLQTIGGHHDKVFSLSFSPNATFRMAYKSPNTKKLAIRTYVFTWVIDAKNMLLAFANRNFSGDPLPFLRRMYPHFFDHTTERYLLYNDETKEVELKTDVEISQWFEQKRIELIPENLDRRTFKNDEAVNENILLKLTRLKF